MIAGVGALAYRERAFAVTHEKLKGLNVTSGRKLELHLDAGNSQRWCLTYKTPHRDVTGAITGLVGISRDLEGADARRLEYRRLADAVEYVKQHYNERVSLETVADVVQLTWTDSRSW